MNKKQMSEENKAIALKVIQGAKAREVAKEYGKSEQRVHIIIKKYCVRFFMLSELSTIKKEKWNNKKICAAVKKIIDVRDGVMG